MKIARQLFVHNIRVNGLDAILYCHGLSASRYVEYAGAMAFLLKKARLGTTVLELGSGHSILPTIWQQLQMEVTVVDMNRGALLWQIRKSKKIAGAIIGAILADMQYLPFKDECIDSVSCISAIEHIPDDGDIETAAEIGRILKDNGLCVISMPLSTHGKTYFKQHWATGIPPLLQDLLGTSLHAILNKFKVDRTSSYFERFSSLEDVDKRVIASSKCVRQDYFVLGSGRLTKFIHQKVVPTGFLTLLEYLIAKFLATGSRVRNADAIILELRKACF